MRCGRVLCCGGAYERRRSPTSPYPRALYRRGVAAPRNGAQTAGVRRNVPPGYNLSEGGFVGSAGTRCTQPRTLDAAARRHRGAALGGQAGRPVTFPARWRVEASRARACRERARGAPRGCTAWVAGVTAAVAAGVAGVRQPAVAAARVSSPVRGRARDSRGARGWGGRGGRGATRSRAACRP